MTLLVAVAFAGTSQLWGEAGELWQPTGRLPDFSYAGYRAGEEEPPAWDAVVDVRDHGAVGDGETDDTQAFRDAIAAVPEEGGVVLVPAGTWRLEQVLTIDRSHVVLRGEGRDATTLFFPLSLEEILGEAEQWSWNGGLIWVEPTERGVSVTSVSEAARGDTSLTVSDVDALSVGQLVELRLLDDDEGSLGRHLHAEQNDAGDCDWQSSLSFAWPVRIAAISGNVVTLQQPLRLDAREAWSPRLYTLPALEQVGVEDLTLRFPETEYAGHLAEPGYNGLFLYGGVVDSWVRGVDVHNADNGFLLDQLTKHILIEDVHFTGRGGHHGFNVAYSADSLATSVHFSADYYHALTVDHRASGNVFSHVDSDDIELELDHHRDSPLENLFTAFAANTNLVNGGSWCAGDPGGARSTLWNLASPTIPPYWKDNQVNVVGLIDGEVSLTDDQEWMEHVEDLRPRNLHLAQRALRLGLPYSDTGVDAADTDPRAGEAPATEPDGCGCTAGRPVSGGWLALLALLATRRSRRCCRSPTCRSPHRLRTAHTRWSLRRSPGPGPRPR